MLHAAGAGRQPPPAFHACFFIYLAGQALSSVGYEPLLDNAMLTLSHRQRELVLFRYFQNMSATRLEHPQTRLRRPHQPDCIDIVPTHNRLG
jgi:hypothetical protein